jgi:hypothetical protein
MYGVNTLAPIAVAGVRPPTMLAIGDRPKQERAEARFVPPHRKGEKQE